MPPRVFAGADRCWISTRIYPGPFVGAFVRPPLVRRPSGADYDASSRSRSPRANEPSRDAAARDVSAVTARVHIEVSAPSSRDSPGQHLQYRRPTNSPKAGLTFTFDYFAHAILLTRPDLR